EHFQILLKAIVAHPSEKIARLPLLSDSERNRILVEWNQTETDYPRTAMVHELFERQADRAPDRIALVFGEETLTYRELRERSNQLAWHLRKLGVRTGEPIGICLERSIELIVGLLGILKSV